MNPERAQYARMIGARAKRIREFRGKTLEVIAGLAGISKSRLHRIENGETALDKLSDIVALAGALEVSPSGLVQLPLPGPANGHTDSATESVRLALDAVEAGLPNGVVLPVGVLRDQVIRLHEHSRACRFAEVTTELPELIHNLHTTLRTGGAYHGDLLHLAVYLHVHVTRMWLVYAAAPTDLLRRTVFLARRLAGERDDVATLALAGFGLVDVLLKSGAFSLGQSTLDAITLPSTTVETAGLACAVTASHALAAAVNGRLPDTAAPMEAAVEMAVRFGENATDPLGFAFGPSNVAFRRMGLALEMDEPDRAISIAGGTRPESNPFPASRVYYWMSYGRALSKLPGRQDDAVRALLTAEKLFPTAVLRHPGVREALGEMLARSRYGVTGAELRGMAYRAGLLPEPA